MTVAGVAESRGSFENCSDLIRVWRLRLDALSSEVVRFEQVLSQEETERASRYQFDRDRRRFTVTRATLRFLLGGYLQIPPERVLFNYGVHGKPSMVDPAAGIHFSVSHSEEMAVIAIAHRREVGVDIEFMRPLADREKLIETSFSSRERAEYRSLPHASQPAAFFAGWTRKEAYLKARGTGFSIPPESFTVTLRPDEPAALLEVRNEPIEQSRWGMANLNTAPGYAGALVAEGTGWRIDYADWNG